MNSRYFIALLFLAKSIISIGQTASDPEVPYYPTNHPRMVAEWEPATAVLIAWPLSIPHKLVVELAKDIKVQILVEDLKAKQDAIKWLTKWGIYPDRIKFITAPQGIDVSWTRDWGPHAVFNPDGNMLLADGKYLYAGAI